MAGHNLVIRIQSANQVEQITVSEEAVAQLMPGTPAETANIARDAIVRMVGALIAAKRDEVLADWTADNITIQS